MPVSRCIQIWHQPQQSPRDFAVGYVGGAMLFNEANPLSALTVHSLGANQNWRNGLWKSGRIPNVNNMNPGNGRIKSYV